MQVNTILQGKAEEELFKLPAGSVHLVVTSPPYNVGVEYGNGHNDSLHESEYYDWCQKWINGCHHVLCDGGRVAVNIPHVGNSQYGKFEKGLQTYIDKFIPMLNKAGFMMREALIWVKSNAEFDENNFCGSNTAWGSWLSPNNPACRAFSESILVAHKGRPDRSRNEQNDITKEEFMRYTRNVWFMPGKADKDHPAPFPEELPYRLIKLYTWPGDIVLDPFTGSGTTLLVAEKLGREWMGIEQNPEFVKLATKRIDRVRYQTKLQL